MMNNQTAMALDKWLWKNLPDAYQNVYSGTTVDPYSKTYNHDEFKNCFVVTGWEEDGITPIVDLKRDEEQITPRAKVLREAEVLITGDRNHTYGSPTQNFTNIAELLTTRFKHKFKDGEKFEAHEVADLMILMKVARNVAQPKRDTYVDIAGYAACGLEALLDEE